MKIAALILLNACMIFLLWTLPDITELFAALALACAPLCYLNVAIITEELS